ncbi:MAG: hypothetical protein Q8O33_06735 [Pseudomonadota bacterium]|nr:hypothetical protein [Pseudomonadota bacterium]
MVWPKPKICPSWLSREKFDAFPEALEVREPKVGHKLLVTTLLCANQAPKKARGEVTKKPQLKHS